MTVRAYDVATITAAERSLMARLPEGTLMARAAAGLARRCALVLRGSTGGVYGARVVLLVGAGNNGGDALYAGALLARRGAAVSALLLAPERAHAGGLAALRAAGGQAVPAAASSLADTSGAGGPAAAVARADLVVDGITGIGGSGGLRPAAVALLAQVRAPVVAVDLPSGVDADTGAVDGEAVRAAITVTFGCLKPGLLVGAGRQHAGLVEVVDIGLEQHLGPPALSALEADDVATLLGQPPPGATKYTRGVVGVVAGSDAYTGAAVLAVGGALRAGAGMVRFASVSHPADLVRARWPEAVVTVVPAGAHGTVADPDAVLSAGRVQAWVVGSGLGTDDDVAGVLRALLATDVPVLVDADGLTVLARHPDLVRERSAPTLLTPHDGEFARLAGDVGADRVGAARRAAADLGATVLLKGDATIVADPDGEVSVNRTGTSWLATAGSGDVLSGVCGVMLAAGLPARQAGAVGAFLHGLAAREAAAAGGASPGPILAADLLDTVRPRLP